MVFASLFFVFVFLTINLLSQIILPTPKLKNIAMLICSLIFYTWTGIRCTLLMLLMVYICKVGAIYIEDAGIDGKSKKIPLAVTIFLCLAILGVFKYTGFAMSTAAFLTGENLTIPEIVLPVGISFYTFQLISYVVDVYRAEIAAQRSYWRLLLYACLFHQCIAGPIVRYKDVQQDLDKREMNVHDAGEGVRRFCTGLMKKAVIANSCSLIADKSLGVGADALTETSAAGIFLGLFALYLRNYFDFSGYSDMAIGMGLICGLHYKENFNYPYISQSVSELWRRWHISLCTFFRDYLYFPLGGSRCSVLMQLRNLFVVWFLTGLWHGAGWNYVLWGLYWGFMLVIQKFIVRDKLSWLPAPVKVFGITMVSIFGLTIFQFTDLSLMIIAFKGLFMMNGNALTDLSTELMFKNNIFLLIFGMVAATPFFKIMRERLKEKSQSNSIVSVVYSISEVVIPLILFLLAVDALAGDSYNPFIYFQF